MLALAASRLLKRQPKIFRVPGFCYGNYFVIGFDRSAFAARPLLSSRVYLISESSKVSRSIHNEGLPELPIKN